MIGKFYSYGFGVLALLLLVVGSTVVAEPFPIDPLWKSPGFRKAYTGSYGVDSSIEPQLKQEEVALLNEAAKSMANEDRKGAINKLQYAELTKKSPALLFSLGNYFFEEDQPEKSIENFQKAIELFPNFRDAHRNLAMLYVKQDEFDKAEPHLARALELGSKEGLTFGLLAHCHARKDRNQAALSAYRMAQMTMPDEKQWIVGEAYTLHALEKSAEASSIYESLLKDDPGNANLWVNQAHTFVQRELYERAIANFEVVNRMEKLTPTNRFYLGQLYLDQGFAEVALEHIANSIREENQIPFDSATDALVRMVSGAHWESAEALGKLCSNRYQDDLEVKGEESSDQQKRVISRFQRSMALIDLEKGQTQAGAGRVEKLIEQNPLDGDALLLLAKFHEKSGEVDEAITLLEQAALINEKRARALSQHGMILINHRNDYKKALLLLEESHRLDSANGLGQYLVELRKFVNG